MGIFCVRVVVCVCVRFFGCLCACVCVLFCVLVYGFVYVFPMRVLCEFSCVFYPCAWVCVFV